MPSSLPSNENHSSFPGSLEKRVGKRGARSLAILWSRDLWLRQKAKSHPSPDILATSNDVEPVWRPSESAWHAAGHRRARGEVQVGEPSKKLVCEGGGVCPPKPTRGRGTPYAETTGCRPEWLQLRRARWTRQGPSPAREP